MAAEHELGEQYPWPVLADGTLDLAALPAFMAQLAGAAIFAENCGASREVSECYKKLWLAKCIIEFGIVPVGAGPDRSKAP